MNDDAAEKAIYKIFIKAPIEIVWSTLVKTDEALPFFFGAVCNAPGGLTPGEPMAMRTKSGAFTSVVGKVLEFDPPRRYAHTLLFTNVDEPPATVIYDLKEVDGGVEFTLTTLNAPADSKTGKSMAQGGPMIVNTLKAICETGRPSWGVRIMLGLAGVLEPFSPKASRTQNWPADRIRAL